MNPHSSPTLDAVAERYVRLALAAGQHDQDFVDAYFGPPGWAEDAEAAKLPLPSLIAQVARLSQDAAEVAAPAEPELALRHRSLLAHIDSMAAHLAVLAGERRPFDAESEAIYGVRVPRFPDDRIAEVHAQLDERLPAGGSLAERLARYRDDFIVPKDRLEPVMHAALAEARRRTLAHLELPPHEAATLELVTDRPWGGYNWFKGNAASLIQINTDLPNVISRATMLAAHEGYPGHHVYSTLLEQHLVQGRGWVEFAIYPLFSPRSLLSEGAADYGIELVFDDAPEYMRDVLFPLAGLDPAGAENFVTVERIARELWQVECDIGRDWLDGNIARPEAHARLVETVLLAPEMAERTLGFFDTDRTYMITYSAGEALVRRHVEREAGIEAAPARKWEVFGALLSSPRLAADLA